MWESAVVVIDVEFQLMRDWQPRSRPSMGQINVPGKTWAVLYPGAGSVGMERMAAVVTQAARISEKWLTYQVGLEIEGVPMGPSRPGVLYLGASDMPSGVVHFPAFSTFDNEMYRGIHSLLVRAV